MGKIPSRPQGANFLRIHSSPGGLQNPLTSSRKAWIVDTLVRVGFSPHHTEKVCSGGNYRGKVCGKVNPGLWAHHALCLWGGVWSSSSVNWGDNCPKERDQKETMDDVGTSRPLRWSTVLALLGWALGPERGHGAAWRGTLGRT